MDLEQLRLGFGGASISGDGGGYGFGSMSEDEAISLVRYAFDRGVRLFDTAPIYGFGTSEVRLGKALKQVREKVFLVSKGGVHWHSSKRVDMTNDPKVLNKMLNESLKRLNSDYIDLYMIHWPDPKVDIRFALEVLAKAKLEGKIHQVGLCNTNIEDLNKSVEVVPINWCQSELNVFNHYTQLDFLKELGKRKIKFMSWGTLDKGILTGKVKLKRHYDEFDCRRNAPWFKESIIKERIEKFDSFKDVLIENNISPLEFALESNLLLAEVNHLLCGAKNKLQLDSILDIIKSDRKSDLVKTLLEKFHAI